MAVRMPWVGVCVPLALSLHYFQCNRIKLNLFSSNTVFHDISKIQQRALIGKIFARWHLAIAITSNIARSKYNHVMCILCSINHQSKIIFYWYQSYH